MKLATLLYVVACLSFAFGFVLASVFSLGRIGGRR